MSKMKDAMTDPTSLAVLVIENHGKHAHWTTVYEYVVEINRNFDGQSTHDMIVHLADTVHSLVLKSAVTITWDEDENDRSHKDSDLRNRWNEEILSMSNALYDKIFNS